MEIIKKRIKIYTKEYKKQEMIHKDNKTNKNYKKYKKCYKEAFNYYN